MGFAFNPFTGNFDLTGSGGGGASYIDGEEAVYGDLSLDAGVAPLNSAWLVRNSSGIWPFNKPGGIYIRTATLGVSRDADYTYAGTMPDVFSDAVLTIYDEASTTRTGQFNLGSVTAGQNRVLTWPDGNGTIARTETFAAPPAIGNTTPAAITGTTGTFTSLTATPAANTTALTSTGYSLTGSNAQSLVDLAGTWNTTGTPTAFKLNITNTASNAASLLADLQVGGVSQFSVNRSGGVSALGGYTAGVGRWYDNGANGFVASHSGTDKIRILSSPDYFILSATTELTWGSSGVSSVDLRFAREAAGTLAQRNGSNPQTFRLYNTYTSATNFERLNVRWASNELIIDAEAGSAGGTLRGIKLGSASTSLLGFFGATPVVRQAAVADATDAASTQARLNDLLARLRTLGLIAT